MEYSRLQRNKTTAPLKHSERDIKNTGMVEKSIGSRADFWNSGNNKNSEKIALKSTILPIKYLIFIFAKLCYYIMIPKMYKVVQVLLSL